MAFLWYQPWRRLCTTVEVDVEEGIYWGVLATKKSIGDVGRLETPHEDGSKNTAQLRLL